MNWYYAKNGAQHGPVALEDMKSRIAMGEISPTDLAWREGMADWLPVSGISELKVEAPPARMDAQPSYPVQAPAPTASAPVEPYRAPGAAPIPGAAGQMVPGQVPVQGLSIASMVCGIVSLLICCVWYVAPVLGLVAVVLGFVALAKIKSDPARNRGKGMAITGVVTGALALICSGTIAYFALQLQGLTPEQMQEKILNWAPESMREEMRKEMNKEMEKQKNQSAPAR
jgi:hypothetical protein